MLELLATRYRQKLDSNFMRILDACYFYHKSLYTTDITESSTFGDLVADTGLEEIIGDKVAGTKLKNYKFASLKNIQISSIIADTVIYNLKSKVQSINCESITNALYSENSPFILELSSPYSLRKEEDSLLGVNEARDGMTFVCMDSNGTIIHNEYQKTSQLMNRRVVYIDDTARVERLIDDLYGQYYISDDKSINISMTGVIQLINNAKSFNRISVPPSDALSDTASLILENKLSTYIDKNHVVLFDIGNTTYEVLNVPYDMFDVDLWDVAHVEKCKTLHFGGNQLANRIFATNPYFLTDSINVNTEYPKGWYTNGYRMFDDNQIYMAYNELALVKHNPSAVFNFGSSECKYTPELKDSLVQSVSLPDGTFKDKDCVYTLNHIISVGDKKFTVIRDIDTDKKYLAWSDDESSWNAFIELPVDITKFVITGCNEYFISMLGIDGCTWAYSLCLPTKQDTTIN